MGSVTSWMAVIRRQPARNSPVVSWTQLMLHLTDLNRTVLTL